MVKYYINRLADYNKPGLKDSKKAHNQYNQQKKIKKIKKRKMKIIKSKAYGILVRELLKQRLREKEGIKKAVIIQKYCRRYLAQKKVCDIILNPSVIETNALPKFWVIKTSSEYPGVIYYYNTKTKKSVWEKNKIY